MENLKKCRINVMVSNMDNAVEFYSEKLGLELIQPLLDESKKCAEEKIVDNDDLVDAGVIFGTGFAPFRGGPLHFRSSLAGLKLDSASATS